MSAQDQTLDQYQKLMHLNAVSHLIRAGRRLGIFAELEKGQHTAEQLCDALSLESAPTGLLLDALVAIGIIEKYGEDYALSQAARLLCQYDDDLGDARWEAIEDLARGVRARDQHEDQAHHDHMAATQWTHTPAAMQAAEILDVGGEDFTAGPKILDVGCGSAVWSCALAHRDPEATITLIDHRGSLEAAIATATSIGLADRVTAIEGDPEAVPLGEDEFDLVVLAQRLHSLGDAPAGRLLDRAVAAAKPGGQVVVIDEFRSPSRPTVLDGVAALRMELGTSEGRIRGLEETKAFMESHGLSNVQFTFLAASRAGLGMAVGVKDPDSEPGDDEDEAPDSPAAED